MKIGREGWEFDERRYSRKIRWDILEIVCDEIINPPAGGLNLRKYGWIHHLPNILKILKLARKCTCCKELKETLEELEKE